MLIRILAVAALIALGGCAAGGTATAVAQSQVALTAAEKAATLYATLPQCPKGAPICSEAAIITSIKQADNVAFNAVTAARAGGDSATLASANAAIAALVALIPTAATAH